MEEYLRILDMKLGILIFMLLSFNFGGLMEINKGHILMDRTMHGAGLLAC